MKIIFDSEEEKKRTIKSYCPGDIGLFDNCPPNTNTEICLKCWEQTVKMEVEKENN